MRIVLVTHFYPAHGGGVEMVAAQLARRMAAKGVKIIWCASDTDACPALPDVHCVPMSTFNAIERLSGFPYPFWSPPSLMRLARCVRDADAVHVHDCIYPGSLIGAWLARRHGKRLVVTQHIGEVPLPFLLRPVLGLANRVGAWSVLRPADGVAFISPAVRRYFEMLVGALPRFRDVANGVDAGMFHPMHGTPANARKALGFDPARPLLLFVGRFVAKKRLPLVRAMAALRPGWQWCIIGHGPERPLDWGLTNVRVLPPMEQVQLASYYRAADLLVLPSEGEGFPLVVQEAMACGLPACITAEVAAGSTMGRELWVELPRMHAESAELGVAAIEEWLAAGAVRHNVQRDACSRFAALHWRWEAMAEAHVQWLSNQAP